MIAISIDLFLVHLFVLLHLLHFIFSFIFYFILFTAGFRSKMKEKKMERYQRSNNPSFYILFSFYLYLLLYIIYCSIQILDLRAGTGYLFGHFKGEDWFDCLG